MKLQTQMRKYFLDTYDNTASKIKDVNNTKLTFMTWIKMTILRSKIQTQNFTFAYLTQLQKTIMIYYAKTIAFIATMFLGLSLSVAQDYLSPDTSSVFDSYFMDTSSAVSSEANQPVKKPYVRYVVPFDTLTELVTYVAVVEEEEAGTDSLYWRAKRWIKHEFKGNKKQVIKKDDKKEFKIVMECEFPLLIEANKFSKTQNGKVVFDMEIRFKEGRYKYKINNLVHVLEPPPGEEKEIRTYFEFYRKSTINPKGNDAVLMAADKKIIIMLKDLKKYCKEPVFVDDDDW
ncbi:MAG: DUF4468 domain-containing protein [Bacteroidia bacterium]